MDDNCEKSRIGITKNLLHLFCKNFVAAEEALDLESKPLGVGFEETRLESSGSELLVNTEDNFEGRLTLPLLFQVELPLIPFCLSESRMLGSHWIFPKV